MLVACASCCPRAARARADRRRDRRRRVACRGARSGTRTGHAAAGAYSEAQAKRGEARFVDACSGCHARDAHGGSDGPSLAGVDFLSAWDGRSVGDLFTRIRTTMPQDSPSSLSPDAYIEIVAFLLRANGFPANATDLTRDPALLKTLLLARTR